MLVLTDDVAAGWSLCHSPACGCWVFGLLAARPHLYLKLYGQGHLASLVMSITAVLEIAL